MKARFIVLVAALFALSLPAGVFAMEHGEMDHSKMKHEKMEKGEMDHSKMKHGEMDHSKMDHSGMKMEGSMMVLGEETEDGVNAKVKLKDISAAMAEMGMDMTHHLMVFFTEEEGGAAIGSGKVAVKVTGPDGKELKPVKLMGMGKGFGADISLKNAGEYHFKIGTKLEDGKKRMFHFHHNVE